MSGHNKWSKIKHAKGATDAKRSKLFSKLAKEIVIAARDGGGDFDLNPRLRNAIHAARKQSMPGDNIDRAVKKGTGELEGAAIEEITYEGYGPGGVAFLVEVATDNKNRSAADMRSLFSKNQGNMGSAGSVAYLFERQGEIRVPSKAIDEEKIFEAALEAGAEDVTLDEDEHIIRTSPDTLFEVGKALATEKIELTSQNLLQSPKTLSKVEDPSTAKQLLHLFEALDDYEDTQNVYSNFDIPDAVMESLEH